MTRSGSGGGPGSENRGSSQGGAAKAPKKKSSIKSSQGASLPPDFSPIARYPNGCCVQIDRGAGPSWYIIAFRIGRSGPPFASLMRHPPTSEDWNSGLGDSRSIPDDTIVARSCWPLRRSDAESGVEEDPLNAPSQSADGALMFNHLLSTHAASDGSDQEGA